MTLTEHTTQQSQEAHAERVRAIIDAQRRRNSAIRGAYVSGADGYRGTRPLTAVDKREVKQNYRELHPGLLQRLWATLTTMFNRENYERMCSSSFIPRAHHIRRLWNRLDQRAR